MNQSPRAKVRRRDIFVAFADHTRTLTEAKKRVRCQQKDFGGRVVSGRLCAPGSPKLGFLVTIEQDADR